MRHSYINNMWIVTTKNVQKAFLLKFVHFCFCRCSVGIHPLQCHFGTFLVVITLQWLMLRIPSVSDA